MWQSLFTKEQMLHLFSKMGIAEPLPRKHQILYVCFSPKHDYRLGTVMLSSHKSTYGKRLYQYALWKDCLTFLENRGKLEMTR